MTEPVLTVAVIEQAIADVLTTGQSFRFGDRSYTLAELEQQRALLNDIAARESRRNGTMFVRVRIGSAS